MRILLLCPRPPLPPDRGDQRRVVHLAEELARRATVRLICFGSEGAPAPAGVSMRVVPLTTGGRVRANVRRVAPLMPGQVRMFLDAGMESVVRSEIASWRPDVVHVTLARMGGYLPPRGSVRLHMDFIDSLSLNMRTRAESSGLLARAAFRGEAALMRSYEAWCAEYVDTSSVVSEDDRLVRGLESALVIPNGVDLEHFSYDAPVARADELIFFGNLGYFHNVAPAVHVATEVLPRVRALRPGTVLRICGARPAAAVSKLSALDGVEVVGPVDSMADELRRSAVAVLPMFSGSGIKNKVLEAFACGTPVVANALGIQGVEGAVSGEDHLCDEGPDALAAACVSLLEDADRRVALSEKARTLVETQYTWGAQAERLLEAYES